MPPVEKMTGWPNLLQLSALSFFAPALACVVLKMPVGVTVYSGNAVCSVYAHRPERSAEDTWADVVDWIMVAIWVGYNAFLVVDAKFDLKFLPAAAVMAIGVLVARIWTKQLEYRSVKRYILHAAMHLMGAVGSLLLLIE